MNRRDLLKFGAGGIAGAAAFALFGKSTAEVPPNIVTFTVTNLNVEDRITVTPMRNGHFDGQTWRPFEVSVKRSPDPAPGPLTDFRTRKERQKCL
jgi:hypothetical protein